MIYIIIEGKFLPCNFNCVQTFLLFTNPRGPTSHSFKYSQMINRARKSFHLNFSSIYEKKQKNFNNASLQYSETPTLLSYPAFLFTDNKQAQYSFSPIAPDEFQMEKVIPEPLA